MYLADKDRYSKMKYSNCGRSGLMLPKIALGFWHNFGELNDYKTMKEIVFTAFDNGITYFDLANNYGPENGAAGSKAHKRTGTGKTRGQKNIR